MLTERRLQVTVIPSPTGLTGVLGRQAIACIDEFELTTSVAAAIHLQQGTTCLSSNFTFILDSSFLFVLQNFNLLDKTLLDLGSTN